MSANCQSRLVTKLPKSLVLLAVMLLAGCGVTTGTTGITNGGPRAGQPSGTPTVTVTSTSTVAETTTPTVAGASDKTTGCPLPTQVVNWPSPPAVIITPADAPKGITLQVGQTLEVALPFGQRQSIAPAAGGPVLLLNTPAGYGDAGLNGCVWHFTAEQAGQALVTFASAPMCKPGMKCPQYVAIRKVIVTVT